MSSTSEEAASTNNPLEGLEALANASRRPSERPEPPRLAAIGDSPLTRPFRVESPRLAASAGDRLETAMSEFVRRQLQPSAVPEPSDLKREGKRRTLLAGFVGVAAAVAVASVAALLIVTFFPREKGLEQFIAAASRAPRADDAPVSSRALVPTGGSGQSLSHDQSERLLQQFVQWRQNADLTDKR